MYRNLGLRLQAMDNPAESGTLNLGQRMGSGRLKVFPSDATAAQYSAETVRPRETPERVKSPTPRGCKNKRKDPLFA